MTGVFLSAPRYEWCAPPSHLSSCVLVKHGPLQQNSKEEYKSWKWGATTRYYSSHTETMLPTHVKSYVPFQRLPLWWSLPSIFWFPRHYHNHFHNLYTTAITTPPPPPPLAASAPPQPTKIKWGEGFAETKCLVFLSNDPSRKNEKRPSSIRLTLGLSHTQHWGTFWEMDRSAYELSRALIYHLELNWTL